MSIERQQEQNKNKALKEGLCAGFSFVAAVKTLLMPLLPLLPSGCPLALASLSFPSSAAAASGAARWQCRPARQKRERE